MSTLNAAPSRDFLRMLSIVLVVVGLLISGYLSYSKLTETPTICTEGGGFNCEVVQSSVYSRLIGIPIAYLGFLAYLGLGAMIVLENRVSLLRDYGITLVFGITLFAFLFSLWLVYVQAFRLEAFCAWCLGHEVTITLLFIVSGLRLRKAMSAEQGHD
jgi:uncharacterized membrane protein